MTVSVHGGVRLMELEGDGPRLASEQDALDLLGATYGQEIDMIAVPLLRLDPRFFDLSTGMAGAFIQKMQNYQMRLAMVGDISAAVADSNALRDFVYETNKRGHHLFAADRTALLARLAG